MPTFITDSVTEEMYQLDVTQATKLTSTGKLTRHPISGRRDTATDNYVNSPDQVSIEGYITKYKNKTNKTPYIKDPDIVIANLRFIKQSATPVTVTAFQQDETFISGLFGEYKNIIEPIEDCIITSISLEKNAGDNSEIRVRMTLEVADFKEQTEVVKQPNVDPSFQNDASKLQSGVGATKQQPDKLLLQRANAGYRSIGLEGSNLGNVGV